MLPLILSNEFYIMIIVILAIVVVVFKNMFKYKKYGDIGEKITYKNLRRVAKSNKCIVLRNIKLPLYDAITEIDILIICRSGVICVENKHLSGEIYGKPNDEYWLQNKRGVVKKIYNPILQNEGHIKCLGHHFKKNSFNPIKLYNYVIFSNDNAILNIYDKRVGRIKGLKQLIKNCCKNNDYNIDTKKVKKFVEHIDRSIRFPRAKKK